MLRVLYCVIPVVWLVSPAFAQAPPVIKQADTPTAVFRVEREAASKNFPAKAFTAADALIAKAEAASKAGNAKRAAKLVREARWQLPFTPANLPEHVVRVLGASRLRHGDRINSLAYSPDGSKLASASRDGTVKIWDLGNGRELLTYRGHETVEPTDEDRNPMRVPAVAFSPDSKMIASSGSLDIHIWDPTNGKLLHTLKGHKAPAIDLVFSKTANTLISGSDDKRVIVWDIAKEKPSIEFPEQSQRIEAVSVDQKGTLTATVNTAGELFVYSLDGKNRNPLLSFPATDGGQAGYGVGFVGESGIITAGGDSKAKLITAPNAAGTSDATGATLRTYDASGGKINSLAVTADGKVLVTVGKDGSIRLWDVGTAKPIRTYQGYAGAVTAVAISPDGTEIASGGEDGRIRLWPLTVTDEHRANTDAADALWAVAVSPDGSRYAAAGADQTVRIYDAETHTLQKSLTGHRSPISTLIFLDNSHLVSGSGDKLVKIWDVVGGEAKNCIGHESAVLALTRDDSGKLLVSGSVDKTVKGWDANGKQLWNWSGKSAVCTLSARPDGRRIAVGTADGRLTILETTEGKEPRVLSSTAAHGAGVLGVSYHPDGQHIATCGGDGYVRVWLLPAEGPISKIAAIDPPANTGSANAASPIAAVSFSPDGRLLAFGGAESVVRVWELQTREEVRSFRGQTDWVTAVAFAPDEKTLYCTGVDHSVRSFALDRQDELASGHLQEVLCIAMNREGTLLATGSADKTVKVWDPATGREVVTFSGLAEEPRAVGFLDSKTIVTSGLDGRLRWWSIETGRETRSVPTGKVFFLSTAPDLGKIAVIWNRRGEKFAGFDLYKADGTEIAKISDPDRELSCATVSADASLGITGGGDGALRLWNLTTKERIGTDWPLFVKPVADVTLTPDRKTLVAIDQSGQVKIADVQNRTVEKAFQAMEGNVAGIVMSPTGDRFATLTAEGVVKVWDRKGNELRSWKLPASAVAAVFRPDGSQLICGNKDGTAIVLQLP